MSTFYPNPTVVLNREGTPVTGAMVQSVSLEVDEGWTFSATVQGSAIDPYEATDTAYTVDFTDGLGNSQSTPDLTVAQYSYAHQYGQDSPDT